MSVERELDKLKKRVDRYIAATGKNKTNIGIEIRKDGNTVPRLMADKLTIPNVLLIERWLDDRTKK